MGDTNGRTKGGRFATGNTGGPGRPRREVERAYVDATIAAVPIDDWTAIVGQAVADAKAGDGVARAWLSKVLGIDAPSKIAHTDADGQSITISSVLASIVEAPPPPRGPPLNMVDVDAEVAKAMAAAGEVG